MKEERICNFVLLLIVVSSLLFISLSCRKKDNVTPVYSIPVPSASTDTVVISPAGSNSFGKTFLALGDSYTIGQSIDSLERFPAQAAALLSEQNIKMSHITYIAATGWTTLNLKEAIEAKNPQGPFDIVTLLIGVNDQYQTNDTTNYRSRFIDLLNNAISLSGYHYNHVFVLSVPDYGVTPFGGGRQGVSEQIDLFNQICKEVTDSYNISYTDVTGISRADAVDNTMLAGDGLHPSGKQYAQWVQILEPKIFEEINK